VEEDGRKKKRIDVVKEDEQLPCERMSLEGIGVSVTR
jgi:hypothetical protein